MKRLAAVLLAAALATVPLFAAVDMFLKFDTIPGESTQPGHTGWFEISSFSWGASQPGPAACATSHTLNFTRKGPASERLTQLCKQRAQLPTLTIDLGGERHMLQNVAFVQCTSQPVGGGNAFESYALNFGRCATHASALAPNAVAHKIDMKVKMDAPNAILIGLTPRPEAAAVLSLNFMGPNAATLTRKLKANDNGPDGFTQVSRSHQKLPALSITLNNGQKWTFTDVTISNYTGGVHPGAESFSLNFTNVQGPLTGFQDLSYKE